MSEELLKKQIEAVTETLGRVEDVVLGGAGDLSEEALWDLGIDPEAARRGDALGSWVQNAVYDIDKKDGRYRLLLAGGGPTIWLVVEEDGFCRLEGHWAFDRHEEAVGLRELGRALREYLDEVAVV